MGRRTSLTAEAGDQAVSVSTQHRAGGRILGQHFPSVYVSKSLGTLSTLARCLPCRTISGSRPRACWGLHSLGTRVVLVASRGLCARHTHESGGHHGARMPCARGDWEHTEGLPQVCCQGGERGMLQRVFPRPPADTLPLCNPVPWHSSEWAKDSNTPGFSWGGGSKVYVEVWYPAFCSFITDFR